MSDLVLLEIRPSPRVNPPSSRRRLLSPAALCRRPASSVPHSRIRLTCLGRPHGAVHPPSRYWAPGADQSLWEPTVAPSPAGQSPSLSIRAAFSSLKPRPIRRSHPFRSRASLRPPPLLSIVCRHPMRGEIRCPSSAAPQRNGPMRRAECHRTALDPRWRDGIANGRPFHSLAASAEEKIVLRSSVSIFDVTRELPFSGVNDLIHHLPSHPLGIRF
jgi:hypothetical protein